MCRPRGGYLCSLLPPLLLLPQGLEAEVLRSCADLNIPAPIPVSVLLGSLGHQPDSQRAAAAAAGAANNVAAAAAGSSNVFVALLLAALHPEGHVPDTPARKVRGGIAFHPSVYVYMVIKGTPGGSVGEGGWMPTSIYRGDDADQSLGGEQVLHRAPITANSKAKRGCCLLTV